MSPTTTFIYDQVCFQPPAPVAVVELRRPSSPRDPTQVEYVTSLIDTGSDITVMPSPSIHRLGLLEVDILNIRPFGSDTPLRMPLFSAYLRLPPFDEILIRVLPTEDAYGIIGRDLANRWMIVLDGPHLSASITAP